MLMMIGNKKKKGSQTKVGRLQTEITGLFE